MTDARISRAVPLDQLRPPETDVREHRPEDAVMSLAASMGDPDVGQLQDVLVHPVDEDADDIGEHELPDIDDWTRALNDDIEVDGDLESKLHDIFAAGWPMRIVDGETRRLAAAKLGWATLNATIVPEPPESTVIAQIDANTERLTMSDFETVRAVYDVYEQTDATLDDMADQTGFSPSYLSQVFSLIEAPEWLVEPWRHPDHPLETSHARAVYAMLSENAIEEYKRAGDLDDEEAHRAAVDDAQLMIDVQAKHDLQVGDFRQRCQRCRKESLDQLKDQRSLEEKRADGQSSAAETETSTGTPAKVPEETCIVCGDEADRKIALDVCREDYGMLSEMKAAGDVLMAQASSPPTDPPTPDDQPDAQQQAAHALADAVGIDPDQAAHVVDQVRQQAAQSPQEPTDD